MLNPLFFALALAASARSEMLVSTEWLAAHLNDPAIRVVDMRRQGFEEGHIPGAVFLANEALRKADAPPTFLPSVTDLEAIVGRLGISNRTRVVVYDDRGGIYAARLWFVLSYLGHPDAALVDGGWVKWTQEGRPMTRDNRAPTPAAFKARPNPRLVATADDVRDSIGKKGIKIVDARTTAEIEGRELRGIRRAGFIPSSIPVYWEDALNPESKTFKPNDELVKVYRDRGILPSDEIITYCQIGMRASHDLFVLKMLGYEKLRNYYGAWEEWGNRDDLPIATKK